ncbi:MAG: DUF4010 domain-containing protein [Acidobacteria bacterium]|nr:DUF4010 domain-containing protein [Acidobacteriota bacterium]
MLPSQILEPFLLTLAISFLIGIGLREYYEGEQKFDTFGTVRTFVFIGMLGFVLFQLPEVGHYAYLGGFAALSVFLALYYANKIAQKKSPGMIGILIGLTTYAVGPITLLQPAWYLVLIAISILFVLHSKGRIRQFTDRLETGEVVTVCKFLAIAGVALPLIPTQLDAVGGRLGWFLTMMPVTPRQAWLAVVITTSISYAGYVMQTYLFPRRGLLLTGLIGGIYSSTATVLVLARKSKEAPSVSDQAAVAVLSAVAMMYLRLLVLVVIFRFAITPAAAPALVTMAAMMGAYAFWIRSAARHALPGSEPNADAETLHKNPLELSTAFVFAVMFAVIAVVTKYTLEVFRDLGLRVLSFVVGFSDITPFVVSVLQGNLGISDQQILQAVIISSASNNILKSAYTWAFGSRRTAQLVSAPLVGVALLSIIYAIVLL